YTLCDGTNSILPGRTISGSRFMMHHSNRRSALSSDQQTLHVPNCSAAALCGLMETRTHSLTHSVLGRMSNITRPSLHGDIRLILSSLRSVLLWLMFQSPDSSRLRHLSCVNFHRCTQQVSW